MVSVLGEGLGNAGNIRILDLGDGYCLTTDETGCNVLHVIPYVYFTIKLLNIYHVEKLLKGTIEVLMVIFERGITMGDIFLHFPSSVF